MYHKKFERGRKEPRQKRLMRPRRCRLCHERVQEVDYKDLQNIQRFISSQSKIVSRKRSSLCASHQRMVQQAIQRARIMALVPFVG